MKFDQLEHEEEELRLKGNQKEIFTVDNGKSKKKTYTGKFVSVEDLADEIADETKEDAGEDMEEFNEDVLDGPMDDEEEEMLRAKDLQRRKEIVNITNDIEGKKEIARLENQLRLEGVDNMGGEYLKNHKDIVDYSTTEQEKNAGIRGMSKNKKSKYGRANPYLVPTQTKEKYSGKGRDNMKTLKSNESKLAQFYNKITRIFKRDPDKFEEVTKKYTIEDALQDHDVEDRA